MGENFSTTVRPVYWLATLDRRLERARIAGALEHVASRQQLLADSSGLTFRLRVLTGPARKPQRGAGDPFAVPEPELWLAEVPPHHRLLLNKYPVLSRHLLLITRRFAEQRARLDCADFAAAALVLREFDALVFYNAGAMAGASQAHRHLQLIPRRPDDADVPAEAVIRSGSPTRPGTVALPYPHAVQRLTGADNAAALADAAGGLLAAIGRPRRGSGIAPYNLVFTRDWMLAVPRCAASCNGIAVNALGYVGLLLARDDSQASRLCRLGAGELLRRCACQSEK